MINGNVIFDNSLFVYEHIKKDEHGLYSITHSGFYPPMNLYKYIVYFDEGYIKLSIDQFWDDINFIEIYLNTETEEFRGELIEHNINNVIN